MSVPQGSIAAAEHDGLPAALRGALWMGGAMLSFAIMAVAARELLRTMGGFETLFFRSLVSFVLMLAILSRFGLGALRTGSDRSGRPRAAVPAARSRLSCRGLFPARPPW